MIETTSKPPVAQRAGGITQGTSIDELNANESAIAATRVLASEEPAQSVKDGAVVGLAPHALEPAVLTEITEDACFKAIAKLLRASIVGLTTPLDGMGLHSQEKIWEAISRDKLTASRLAGGMARELRKKQRGPTSQQIASSVTDDPAWQLLKAMKL